MQALSDMIWISLGPSRLKAPLRRTPPWQPLSLLCYAQHVGQAATNSHQSVSLESHGCNGGQKLETTRAVLVLLASTQNMNRTSPGPWAAPDLRLNPRGALPMRIKGCVPFLRRHNGGRGPVEGAVKRGGVHACPTKPKLPEG